MTNNDPLVPILTYHSIDSTGSVISTSLQSFRMQMQSLVDSKMRVLPLHEIVACMQQQKPFPENAVTITFDDGFRSVFDSAFPVLREYDFPATVFLVTSYCGKDNRWYGQPDQIPTLALMDWKQIESMSEWIEFGIHTATHPDLTKLDHARLQDEILGAQEALQHHIGKKDQAFAYPYGKHSSKSAELVKKHFYAACSTKMDFASTGSDLYFLPRIDMFYFSRNHSFSSIGTGAFRRYVRFRAFLRDTREKFPSLTGKSPS